MNARTTLKAICDDDKWVPCDIGLLFQTNVAEAVKVLHMCLAILHFSDILIYFILMTDWF